ncbi:DUF3318 domain-containing protein [Pandoraea pulmonicola]|uniref:Protein of uncharacterized function (DUF3318) n=1 Tax=Pandoraea pulmonicola TaxID=93221 RepID=A0AAJ4ZFJ1_PANPU|nr:DUF3318 domain-containing protein [Pandoraea pulmonicola]APD13602.1 hypothetical protein RO07_01670 [Pandoraea pulmonicola]SUA92427.1 Protein of uncharacterised function (DUF3318) [Pandoraea pulmonicola]
MPLEPNRPRRTRPSRRSRHELLAIRKELVLTRIAVERAELIQASRVTRERLRNFRWIRYLLPGGLSKLSGIGGLANSGLKLGGLLERYPLVSSVASLALTGLSHTPVGRVLRRSLKWGGLGVLAWQGIKLWQASTKSSAPPADDAAAGHTSATGDTRSSPSGNHESGTPPVM